MRHEDLEEYGAGQRGRESGPNCNLQGLLVKYIVSELRAHAQDEDSWVRILAPLLTRCATDIGQMSKP